MTDEEAMAAEVTRLRALPVIATCGECKHCTAMGRPNVKVPRRPLTAAEFAKIVAFYHCEHPAEKPVDATGVARLDPTAAPPAWCPLRGLR